ncbi:protein LYRIC isoform X2 [Pangasianodon hypophthalmus]|uniref:protein LYRIC isoform X2 n=1 Tax=Pangasianodon hypophthalmus TaxID=310915 RepID=UPI0023083549|nr:protein LYRIC isoform X2 [Pangasianodon hypophthalmus]
MALEWREAAERMDVYLRELLSSGLLLLHAELGVDVGLKAELLPPGLLACVAAGLGLLLAVLLWLSVCRCFSKKPAEKVAPEAGKTSKPKSEEVKKKSRKRGGGDKAQRNGLAVDLEEELKPAETQNQNQNLNQNQSESPDPAGGKSDKGKKNKKKAKASVKETKSPSTSEHKEPEEAGTWETKVSHREKRQQLRKDKGAGDESGSPGGTEPRANAANTEHTAAVEEPKIILTPSVTSNATKTSNANTTRTTNTKTSNTTTTKTSNTNNTTNTTNTKTSNTTNTTNATTTKTSNTNNTTTTKTSTTTTTNSKTTKNTKTTTAPAPKAQKNGQRTQQGVPPGEHEPPVAEVTRAVIPPVSRAWDVMTANGSGSWDLGMSVPPHTQTWNSVKSEASVWPQDMEGSWMIVDGSHIPVSLHGMTAGVEATVVPERPWACPAPVDDEWSGPNSGSADPASDYCAPCEEWGNYEEPAGGAVSPDEPQDSDPEKDKDEPAAPGSSKAKKKKKKKKKAEEAGSAAQMEVEVGVAKDQNTAGNILPKTTKEQEIVVSPRVPLKPTEPEAPPKNTAPPTQKKPEESWESPKQVKKKKARRET